MQRLVGAGLRPALLDAATYSRPPTTDNRTLGDADDLIRRRLKEIDLEVPHVVVTVTPDGQVILRNNVSPAVLRSFGDELKNVAGELTAPPKPGDTTH